MSRWRFPYYLYSIFLTHLWEDIETDLSSLWIYSETLTHLPEDIQTHRFTCALNLFRTSHFLQTHNFSCTLGICSKFLSHLQQNIQIYRFTCALNLFRTSHSPARGHPNPQCYPRVGSLFHISHPLVEVHLDLQIYLRFGSLPYHSPHARGHPDLPALWIYSEPFTPLREDIYRIHRSASISTFIDV